MKKSYGEIQFKTGLLLKEEWLDVIGNGEGDRPVRDVREEFLLRSLAPESVLERLSRHVAGLKFRGVAVDFDPVNDPADQAGPPGITD